MKKKHRLLYVFREKNLNSAPIFLALFTAMYYLIFFCFKDYFPAINQIILFPKPENVFWNLPLTINLPISVSRLWDVPAVFILSSLAVSLYFRLTKIKNRLEELCIATVLGLSVSIITGLGFLVHNGLNLDLKICFLSGLIISGLVSLATGFSKGFISGLKFSLVLSAIIGVTIGLIIGFKTSFILSLIISLIFFLEAIILSALAIIGGLLKYVLSEKFWNTINQILTGELN
ncbi:MAG: hypothetical protein WCK59_00700 [Candidatus Falkowbacteria bacterium]